MNSIIVTNLDQGLFGKLNISGIRRKEGRGKQVIHHSPGKEHREVLGSWGDIQLEVFNPLQQGGETLHYLVVGDHVGVQEGQQVACQFSLPIVQVHSSIVLHSLLATMTIKRKIYNVKPKNVNWKYLEITALTNSWWYSGRSISTRALSASSTTPLTKYSSNTPLTRCLNTSTAAGGRGTYPSCRFDLF